jgi:hypothetical protein
VRVRLYARARLSVRAFVARWVRARACMGARAWVRAFVGVRVRAMHGNHPGKSLNGRLNVF